MNRFFCIIIWLCTSLSVSAQIDWYRLLSGTIKAGQAVMITDEELASIVGESVKAMDIQNKVCEEDSPYSIRLRKLSKDMKDADGIELNFKVYKTNEINAFACPDGSVRVFSALMDILEDDELLGVIGHEIGHVALRHSKKAWQYALLRSAVSDAFGVMSGTWANLSDSFLGGLTSAALTAKHSRYHETQADDYGYEFLKECGKNPWAMGLAFKKLKAISQKKDRSKYEKWLDAFSSHPDFDERIERMREKAEEDGFISN